MKYNAILRPSFKNVVLWCIPPQLDWYVGRNFFHVPECSGSEQSTLANSADLDQNIP